VLATAEVEGRLARGRGLARRLRFEIPTRRAGATVLRYELIRGSAPLDRVSTGATKVLLEHAIDLDPRADYLMRADRVDFAPAASRCRTGTAAAAFAACSQARWR